MFGRLVTFEIGHEVSAEVWVWCSEQTSQEELFSLAFKKLESVVENDDLEIIFKFSKLLKRIEGEKETTESLLPTLKKEKRRNNDE